MGAIKHHLARALPQLATCARRSGDKTVFALRVLALDCRGYQPLGLPELFGPLRDWPPEAGSGWPPEMELAEVGDRLAAAAPGTMTVVAIVRLHRAPRAYVRVFTFRL